VILIQSVKRAISKQQQQGVANTHPVEFSSPAQRAKKRRTHAGQCRIDGNLLGYAVVRVHQRVRKPAFTEDATGFKGTGEGIYRQSAGDITGGLAAHAVRYDKQLTGNVSVATRKFHAFDSKAVFLSLPPAHYLYRTEHVMDFR
jgi:hypothetical protein